MATPSTSSFPAREKQVAPPQSHIPGWKAGILEKKRRAKEIEQLLKEEEELKLKSIPEWKLELIKKTRSTTKAPVFKMAAPPLPSTPPPTTVESPSLPLNSQQEYPPLPTWIREKLSQVANQLKSDNKPQGEGVQPEEGPDQAFTPQSDLPRMVQHIVHKFSNTTPPPSPLSPIPPADINLMDDPSLAQLPDWKRSIIVRRNRGQELKRLSLTKDDLDIVTSSEDNAQNKSTPDSVDILLQNLSAREEMKSSEVAEVEVKKMETPPTTPPTTPPPVKTIASPRSLFVTQEPQRKVKELLNKFAPTLQPIAVSLSPSIPKSMKIVKREFDPLPTPPHLQVKPPLSPVRKEVFLPPPFFPPPMPLSPDRILTVEEYNKHHALLVQSITRQHSSMLINGNENRFSFIVSENLPTRRPRSLSLDSPITSVDPIKLITEIPQPILTSPPSNLDNTPPSAPVSNANEVATKVLEDVTLSYIDEVSDGTVVPIHRPSSSEQDLVSVPWKDALDKIKQKRQEKEGVETYEKEIIIISSQEGLNLKSSLRGAQGRSKRKRVYFSDKKPSVFQYPKADSEGDRVSGYGMYSFADNQEDLSHRLHPSIFTSRQAYQSDKLQNYTPAILDYFDSLVSPPAQNMWTQGEGQETREPTRDEPDELTETLTAVPIDAEEELDMTNLSDRAAAMIW